MNNVKDCTSGNVYGCDYTHHKVEKGETEREREREGGREGGREGEREREREEEGGIMEGRDQV